MRIGIFPGSFDPLTNGHLDIIERAIKITDKLIIAIANNSAKKNLFTIEERINIITNCCHGNKSIEIVSFEGLLVNYCKDNNISFIVRGLRSTIDFEYENPIASINRKLAPEIESVFLMSKDEHSFISSQIVREIASYHGDLTALVPQYVAKKIQQKF